MSDAIDIELLRGSARGALARYPASLGLLQQDILSDDAGPEALAIGLAQGWNAMLVPEALGGLELGMATAAVIAQEIGRALAPGPFMANLLVLPMLARSMDSQTWLGRLGAAVATGESAVTLLVTEDDTRSRLLIEHSQAESVLLHLRWGRDGGSDGLVCSRVEEPALTRLDPFDLTCPIAELSAGRDSDPIKIDAETAHDLVACVEIWMAAELLGVAERAGEMSIAHAGTRKQFGTVIGSYQAVKHRIVDDYVLRQNATALVAEAASAFDDRQSEVMLLAHAARAAATEAAIASTYHCIQVHGAFGFSSESGIHLAYKRARRLACTFGDDRRSRSRIADIVFGDAA